MSLVEFEHVMAGIAMRNGHAPDEAPSDDEFLDDLATVMREEATRH